MANKNLSIEALELVANRFKILSEPIRLRISGDRCARASVAGCIAAVTRDERARTAQRRVGGKLLPLCRARTCRATARLAGHSRAAV